MNVYVAVFQEARQKNGHFRYSFLALARTKREALALAKLEKGITATGLAGYDQVHAGGTRSCRSARRNVRLWRAARLERIRVLRYAAALLLDGITPHRLERYMAARLGVELPGEPRVGWILRRRRRGDYWDERARRFGVRSRATAFPARKSEYIPAAFARRVVWEQAFIAAGPPSLYVLARQNLSYLVPGTFWNASAQRWIADRDMATRFYGPDAEHVPAADRREYDRGVVRWERS